MQETSIFQKIKETGTHTLIYGMGSVIQTSLSFFLIPLYTKYYSTDQYGILALVSICGTIAGSIFYFGVHSALARSYYDHPEGQERKRVVSTTFFILIAGAIMQISLGFLLRNEISQLLFKNHNYGLHIFIVICGSALGFVNNLFYMLLRFERKSKVVIALNTSFLIITTGLVLFMLIILKMGIMAPILGISLSVLLQTIILGLLKRKSIILAFSIPEMKLQLKWGIAIVLGNFGILILNWADRFFINKYCSLADVGIYSLGYKIGMLVNILLVVPFSQIWTPMRMEYRHHRNVNEFYGLAITYYFIIGLFLTVGLSISSKELLTLMVSRKEYIAAYQVVPFVVFSYLLVGSGQLTNHGIVFERKIHYGTVLTWLCAGVNALLNYIFIPKYGYLAAAYTTLFSFLLGVTIGIIISNHFYKIPFEKNRLLLLFASSSIILVLAKLFPMESTINSLLFKGFLMISLLGVWFLFVLKKREKRRIFKFIGVKI